MRQRITQASCACLSEKHVRVNDPTLFVMQDETQ